MIKAVFTLILPLFFLLPVMGQGNADSVLTPGAAVAEKFESVLKQSNRYKEGSNAYEIIRVELFGDLESTVTRTIGELEKSVAEKEKTIGEQNTRIGSLQSELKTADEEIDKLNRQKDNMSFLGVVAMKKGIYRTVMWLIVGVLAAAVIVLSGSYARSNSVTRQTKALLEKTREEFEAYRKKTLEDEMVLRRQLQDEINKRL